MVEKQAINELVETSVDGRGYEIVRISTKGKKNQNQKKMIERKERNEVVVDEWE